MTPDAFDALVAKLERHAASQPLLYRGEILGLAALGYGYLLLLLAICLLVAGTAGLLVFLSANTLTIKLALVFGIGGLAFAWTILRSLWVTTGEPEGITVTPTEAPALFAELDRLRLDLGAPVIHRVVVTNEFNAAMAQVPRLGIFGWPRNFLVLGLPLMRSLTPRELSSVIAHELGHACGGHGRFGAWIYRVRATWSNLADSLAQGGGLGLVRRFLGWYVPVFNAWTFVLARTQEYEADRAAVRVAGIGDATSALVRVHVLGREAAEQFWPGLSRRATSEAEPPASLLTDFHQGLAAMGPGQAQRWVTEAWRRPTDRVDTHPCLRERLLAMGAPDQVPKPLAMPATSAARQYLGAWEGTVAAELDRHWRELAGPGWRERFAHGAELRQQRDALANKAEASLEERWQAVAATMELDGDAAAESALATLAGEKHPAARFHLGRIRLARSEGEGLSDLAAACAGDSGFIPGACALAQDFLANQGRASEAKVWERQAETYAEEWAKAQTERGRVPKTKVLVAATLTPEQVALLAALVQGHPEVASASLARVTVEHLADQPWHILVVTAKTTWWKWRSEEADGKLAQELAQRITIPVPITVYVGKAHHALGKAAAALPGGKLV